MNPLARELNEIVRPANLYVYRMLSQIVRRSKILDLSLVQDGIDAVFKGVKDLEQ